MHNNVLLAVVDADPRKQSCLKRRSITKSIKKGNGNTHKKQIVISMHNFNAISYFFMHNVAPCHKSKVIKIYLKNKDI